MTTSELHSLLRRAAESDDFESLRSLAAELGQAVKSECHSAATPEQRAGIITENLDALKYSLTLARITRSHLSLQLRSAAGHDSYQDAPGNIHTWQIKA